MALVKTENTGNVRIFNEFLEAKETFENKTNPVDLRLSALEYIINHKEIFYTLRMLTEMFNKNDDKDHVFIDYAFANFQIFPKREEDLKLLLDMLKSENAYLRNATIVFLQQHGKEAKDFIYSLMKSEDKDIRIFAINILGDVKFEDSIDMLREFIKNETDINALMTAIDYMGEIGEISDIPLLEEIKNKFNDAYVSFGIDLAIDRIKG